MAQRLGGKWVFGPAIFLSSALSFLLPVVTQTWGIPATMAMRVTQGIIQGPQTPAFYTKPSFFAKSRPFVTIDFQ